MQKNFESTNRSCDDVSFEDALLNGQAPDRGLYTPKTIPRFEEGRLAQLRQAPYTEIAYEVLSNMVGDEIPAQDLKEIVDSSYDFPVPLEKAQDRRYVMRLDRGPTLSFKDFAARCMARMMQYFLSKRGESLTILTATSGDTGSAVANAFSDMENIKVIVFFPKDEVTERQRKQMTTLKGNVGCVAINGKFGDCQALVKKAFSDESLKGLNLSSANSINIGRLLPQMVYYVYAYVRLAQEEGEEIVFSVPSGNFGDLMGGILAKRMGLPVKRFVVATNANDEFPKFMESGIYSPLTPSRACISNAMNVGHPSNLARLFHLYGGWMNEKGEIKEMPDIDSLRGDLFAVSVDDDGTRAAIKDAYERYGMILEPHGAVGWAGLEAYSAEESPSLTVLLETADPAKFPDEIKKVLGFEPEVPDALKAVQSLEEDYEVLENDYESVKAYLLRLN